MRCGRWPIRVKGRYRWYARQKKKTIPISAEVYRILYATIFFQALALTLVHYSPSWCHLPSQRFICPSALFTRGSNFYRSFVYIVYLQYHPSARLSFVIISFNQSFVVVYTYTQTFFCSFSSFVPPIS